jgi:predicted nucleic acid-binding protein
MFVVDASVALAALLGQDELATAEALILRVAEESAIVPAHWSLEIANVLAREVRRGSIDVGRAAALAGEADGWSLEHDAETSAAGLTRTLALSLAHRLTAYDAAYLELCLRRGLALATFDEALSQAALSLGVDVIAS